MIHSRLSKLEKRFEASGMRPFTIVSGAGHDAMILAEKGSCAMIFFCERREGSSHSPAEKRENRGRGEGDRERIASARSAWLYLWSGEHECKTLGGTRSSQCPNGHLLANGRTFVRHSLPGMKGCTAVVARRPSGVGAAVHPIHRGV